MELNRKNAMKIWEESFGRDVMTVDFAGRKIQKGAYEQKTSAFGWVIAPVVPKISGGKIEPDNLMCMHVRTAEEKSDDYPTFKAADVRYNAVKTASGWVIEQSEDSEAIAEQEAMIAAAMEKWAELFGDAEKVTDFCGREIVREQYLSDCAGAWKLAPYVTSRPAENKNVYIANVQSVEEAYGRTAFRANGKMFTLNKGNNGTYYFKESAAKPQRRSFDLGNPLSVAEKIDRSIEEFGQLSETGVWLDFIMISAVIEAGVPEYVSAALTDTVSFILREQVGSWLTSEVSGVTDADGCCHSFMTFRFISPQISDMERLFKASMLLNTYSSMLTAKFGLKMFKVYNYANNFPGTQIHYPNNFLAGCNAEFKSLISAFFASENGMYEGESATTLYISRFIIYNIKALAEAHPEGETVYYTDAQLAEHNYIYSGLRDAIDSYLVPSPEPEIPQEPEVPQMPEAEIQPESVIVPEPQAADEAAVMAEQMNEPTFEPEATAEADMTAVPETAVAAEQSGEAVFEAPSEIAEELPEAEEQGGSIFTPITMSSTLPSDEDSNTEAETDNAEAAAEETADSQEEVYFDLDSDDEE